jgi:hypoxanthine phosphoribosyltransferase
MTSKRDQQATRGELGEYLREQRRNLGLTLRETALRTGEKGLSRSYLSQVETGKIRRPSPETLSLLVTAYQVDYDELLRKAGYGGVSSDQAPGWMPADTTRLNPDDQQTVAQYIEYLLWRQSPHPVEEDPQGRWISWGEVQEWAHELKAKLDRRGFDPDLVIGLGRGGAILGGMVAGALGLKPVGVLDMRHSPNAPVGQRSIEGRLDLRGIRRALLVQGEVRSGKSLEKAVEELRKKKSEKELELWTIALVVYPEVPLEQRPDEYKRLARLDPPWRRIPGYVRALRKKHDEDA